jgi:hypothetical protein
MHRQSQIVIAEVETIRRPAAVYLVEDFLLDLSETMMTAFRATSLRRGLTLLAAVLVLKVNFAVVWGYRNYLPPDFNSEFLRGREDYFAGAYQWAFYAHIASGPISLLLGTLLISETFRRRLPKWHRRLGRVQVTGVLLVLAPSGLWMAWYAAAGPIGAVGFALMAIATGISTAMGWREAVARRFAAHRRWMWRSYLLLCSAVVIRLSGGLATVVGVHSAWFDPLASWACWIVPLAVFELRRFSIPHTARPMTRSAT